ELEFNIVVTTASDEEPFQLIVQPTRAWSDVQDISYDLSLKQDLCLYFQKSSNAYSASPEENASFLGYLSAGGTFTHFFLFFIPKRNRPKSCSYYLNDAFTKAGDLKLGIQVEEKLLMARMVATGILYLHSTSWLSQEWGIKNVCFYKSDGLNVEDTLKKQPFFQTSLLNNAIQDPLPDAEISGVSNHDLFWLGVFLLELAFSSSWRDLHLHEDIMKGLNSEERDFLTIMRLTENVSGSLGSRYAKLVRSCFRHSFETGILYGHGKSKVNDVIFYEVIQ
ncbi:MAG: hypothetical protein Q9187_009077, partial [Circinaria calcarea]